MVGRSLPALVWVQPGTTGPNFWTLIFSTEIFRPSGPSISGLSLGHWLSLTLRLDRGDAVMDIPYNESSSVTFLDSNTSQFYPLTTERLLYEIFKSDFFQKFNFSINDDVNWPSEDVFRRIKTVICSLHCNFWIKMANFEKILFEIIGFDR